MAARTRRILVRAVVDGDDLAAAQPVVAEILGILNVYGNAKVENAEPYWKFPGSLMMLYSLVPHDDVLPAYGRLLTDVAPPAEWYRSGTDDDPGAVWNADNHAPGRVIGLRWMSVELV
jgi:hypothetical protein